MTVLANPSRSRVVLLMASYAETNPAMMPEVICLVGRSAPPPLEYMFTRPSSKLAERVAALLLSTSIAPEPVDPRVNVASPRV